MLVVKTKLRKSKIHGLGLFADQNIKKGAVVWKFNPVIDKEVTRKQLKSLPSIAKKYMLKYSYLDDNGKFVLCGDDGRFVNHSSHPNCDDETGEETIARRNIKKGEEITSNYYSFDVSSRNQKSIK